MSDTPRPAAPAHHPFDALADLLIDLQARLREREPLREEDGRGESAARTPEAEALAPREGATRSPAEAT